MIVHGTAFTLRYRAFNTITQAFVVESTTLHTLNLVRDGVEAVATGAKTAKSNGDYTLGVSASEAAANVLWANGSSSTAGVILVSDVYAPLKLAVAGGLPTSDANNYIAGIAGVKNQLDDLNDLTAAQVNAQADLALADAGVTTIVTARIDAAVSTRESEASAATRATADQTEHDATQSMLAAAAAVSESMLTGPSSFKIPDTGTYTFALDFIMRDIDATPAALVDPDSNIVDISAVDQTGGVPIGVTLGGTPSGRMTRDSLGRYSLIVTIAATAVDNTQLRFVAAYTKATVANISNRWSVTLGDFDQLDTIESQVNAIRATDVPAIQANIDAQDADILNASQAATEFKGMTSPDGVFTVPALANAPSGGGGGGSSTDTNNIAVNQNG